MRSFPEMMCFRRRFAPGGISRYARDPADMTKHGRARLYTGSPYSWLEISLGFTFVADSSWRSRACFSFLSLAI